MPTFVALMEQLPLALSDVSILSFFVDALSILGASLSE